MPIDATELGAFPIFGPLARDELAKLAAGAKRIEIDEPGVELTQQGEFGHCMFVVLKGKATVAIDGEHVRDISVGDPFGEIAVLTSGRRMYLLSPRPRWCSPGSLNAISGRSRRRTTHSQSNSAGSAPRTPCSREDRSNRDRTARVRQCCSYVNRGSFLRVM